MVLSIVVPCYNVEQYVEKCIESIEKQDVPQEEYEVLVYNDGSSDNTLKILENLANKYSNITVQSHENKGLSGTRNRGIQEAQGDYIWFVDSDDWIAEDCLAKIVSRLTGSVDVLAFSGFIPEGGRVESCKCYDETVINKESLFFKGFADAAQLYIYSREFLVKNNCFFKEGIKHEDTLFTPIVLHKAKNIVFYRKPVYHFLQREGSITTVVDIKRVYDLAGNLEALYSYSFGIDNSIVKQGFLNHMAHHITEMLNYGIDNGMNGEMLIQKIMSEHPEYWKIMKEAIDLKPRLIYWAVKMSPLTFITTYRLLVKLK